ncbi:MAG: ATP-binding protein [Candidatus Micrarchaeia archaeon]
MSELERIYEESEEFRVELEHLMDDISNNYTFEKWRIPIVENVDNFIDEKNYHTISFEISEGLLKIEMKGAGISAEEFKNLSTIAFTTKDFSGKETSTLGYYGWGLKATLIVADRLEIETRYKGNSMKQEWFWRNRRPQYKLLSPSLNLSEDSTVLIYHLKEEYVNNINEKNVIETLQEFYPTLLAGAPALGKKRDFYVNRKKVPEPEWLDENKYEHVIMFKDIYIDEEPVSGRIFISQKELPEEYRGLAIIVCGRKMERRLYTYSDIKNYTGYVHADIFAKRKCLVGDKTQIRYRDNPLWYKFKSKIDQETRRILEEANLIKETSKMDRELIRKAYNIVARVLREMSDLKELGIIGPKIAKAQIYTKGDEVSVSIEEGPATKTDIPKKGVSEGVDQYGWGEEGKTIKPDENGELKASRREGRLRGYPQIIIGELDDDKIEGKYLTGTILINKKHPLYKAVERNELLRNYHVTRAALETIADYLLENDMINSKKYFSYKREMICLLGDNL